ncbi:MAG: nucleotide sugar dehydrogenase [Dehalococcoidia bacterium]|nr:nucleotide sugar dehydrogenase [Dehalococcoidia bacterium]
MIVSVIGAGKMGLPVACQFARNGARVFTCDTNPAVVDEINAGLSPVDEPGIPELLADLVKSGQLTATLDTVEAVRQSNVVVVLVPVLLTSERDADTSIIEHVARAIGRGLQRGTLVSFETTLPVGTTRRLGALIAEASGLTPGADFEVVFSPERVKSQFVLQRLTENIKVVGGLTADGAARAAAFYGRYLGAPVQDVGSAEAAEFVKLAGMVYRDVNIALANELARYSESIGVNLPSIIGAINSDGEAAVLSAGIGVGGHCTPVYPYFMLRDSERRGLASTLTAAARNINDGQTDWALDRLEKEWGALQGASVLILGLGFRPEVKEHILSPAFLLRDAAAQRGASVSLDDPLYTADEMRNLGFTPGRIDAETLPQVLILNTYHEAYRSLDFGQLAARGVRAVIDGRAAWSPASVTHAGICYIGIGQPTTLAG